MALAHTSLFVSNQHGNMNIVDQEICVGRVFFVDHSSANAGDTAQHGQSMDQPFDTVAYAATQCVDLRGDWIALGPNHTETVAAAAGIGFGTLGVPVRDVTVFGVVGHGGARPTITFNGAGADTTVDINIDSDGITFKNIKFLNTEDGALAPLDVNGANCVFDNCVFQDDGTDVTIDWILNVAAGLTVKNCIHYGTSTAGADTWISSGAAAGLRILNNQSYGDLAVANIESTAAITSAIIDGNWLENENAVDANIDLFAASTGFITRNYCRVATDAQVTWIDPGNCMGGENYGVNNNGECGMITGVVSV